LKIATIIPARLESKRFPNKLLAKFNGKSILQNVINYTKQFNFPNNQIILATEDQALIDIGIKNKLDIYFTSARCGTEKAYQYFLQHQNYDYYITIPADEPFIDPNEINKVLQFNKYINCLEILTLYTKFYRLMDLESNLSCKIVADQNDYALYFSRTCIPSSKKLYKSYSLETYPLKEYKKHVGIFIFPRLFLMTYGANLWNQKDSKLAEIEGLEQNRFLEFGFKIKLKEIKHYFFGIDVPSQIPILEQRLFS